MVEDGPTLTHGGMGYRGRNHQRNVGAEPVDPRPYAVGSLRETFATYTQLGDLVPAMGYGETQMRELEETINRTPADAVIIGTPIDLGRILKLNKPAVRVRYDLKELGDVTLAHVLDRLHLGRASG